MVDACSYRKGGMCYGLKEEQKVKNNIYMTAKEI